MWHNEGQTHGPDEAMFVHFIITDVAVGTVWFGTLPVTLKVGLLILQMNSVIGNQV